MSKKTLYFFQSSGLYEGGGRGTTDFLHSLSNFFDCLLSTPWVISLSLRTVSIRAICTT